MRSSIYRLTSAIFIITFAALDYVNSPAIKYAYRIKGLNDQWIDLGNNRSASLVNIPAGDYLFQVKSTNADGVWVDNVTSLSIHIAPVFGETIWAILLYTIIAVGDYVGSGLHSDTYH